MFALVTKRPADLAGLFFVVNINAVIGVLR